MPDVDVVAVLVAAAAAFVLGGAYYGVAGDVTSGAAPSRPTAMTAAVEVVRCLVLAVVVTVVVAGMDVDTWYGGLALGAVLWVGFPLVLFTGAIYHEGTPGRSAATHAGDWLVKLLVMGVIVALMS